MRKWENIVKDKLEETEDALPESVFAEFQACLDGVEATPKGKRFPLGWVMAAAAVAAGLAAVLFFRKPIVPEDGIQMVPQSVEVYSQVDDSLDTADPPASSPLMAQATRTKAVRPMQEVLRPTEVTPIPEDQETRFPRTEDIVPQDTPEEPTIDSHPVISNTSPFVPQTSTDKPAVQSRLDTGGAIAAGGGLLAALATQLARADVSGIVPGNFDIDAVNGIGETASHRLPLVIGLSVKFPVMLKIGVTTGLEYSLYSSSFPYPIGEKTQFVHYLGIPVRLDRAFVSSRWLDAYLGAGIKGDLCIGATLDGKSIGKDGPAFRLLGAGGIQFNATRNLSLFVEPEISWTLPSDRRVLSTYSSEHPWMFTVATGVRYNLGK